MSSQPGAFSESIDQYLRRLNEKSEIEVTEEGVPMKNYVLKGKGDQCSFQMIYFRHQRIINCLKRGPAGIRQIEAYYLKACLSEKIKPCFSGRTFLRDKDMILECYDIEIKYSQSTKKYFIVKD